MPRTSVVRRHPGSGEATDVARPPAEDLLVNNHPQVGSGSLRSGTGSRTLTLRFTTRSQKALRKLSGAKLSLVVRVMKTRLTTYTGTITLRR